MALTIGMNLYTILPHCDAVGIAQDGNSIVIPADELLAAVGLSSGKLLPS